jgi:hypothetical protein
MPVKKRAPETQNHLAAIKARMAVKGTTTEAIVHAFMKQHPEVIAKERSDLVFTALMMFAGRVGAVRPGSSAAAQMEMFKEYDVSKTVLFQMSDGSKKHRQVQTLTIAEGREHVLRRTKPSVRIPSKVQELIRLLDDVDPFKTSDRSTIGECWDAHREAKGG